MLNKKKNNIGFTLVELLVVIAIIGILAVVAVPSLFKNIEKGKVAELESDISAIRSAALSYYAAEGTYPNQTLATNGTTSSIAQASLLKEIESLSNPFDATYTVGNTTTNVNPPSALELKIETTKLSADGLAKLKSDLGNMVTSGNNAQTITVKIISGN